MLYSSLIYYNLLQTIAVLILVTSTHTLHIILTMYITVNNTQRFQSSPDFFEMKQQLVQLYLLCIEILNKAIVKTFIGKTSWFIENHKNCEGFVTLRFVVGTLGTPKGQYTPSLV